MSESPQETPDMLWGEEAQSLWLRTVLRRDDEPHYWNEWVQAHPVCNVSFGGTDFGALRDKVPNGIIFFSGFKFPSGSVSFADLNFGYGPVRFRQTDFGDGDVDFSRTRFNKKIVSFTSVSGVEHPIENVSFVDTKLRQNCISYLRTHFGDEPTDYRVEKIQEPTVSFEGAVFGKGEVDFSSAIFGDNYVSFEDSKFNEGNVDFKKTTFGFGSVVFSRAKFGNGVVKFDHANFGKGAVVFLETHFGDGDVIFRRAMFRNGRKKGEKKAKGNIVFEGSVFGEGNVTFEGAQLGCSGPSFSLGNIRGEEELDYMNVSFKRTNFGKGNVDFKYTRFGNGLIDFEDATFEIGKVNFENTSFGSGHIKFLNTRVAADFRFQPAKLPSSDPLDFKYCTFTARFHLTRIDEAPAWEKPISFEGSSFHGATEIRNFRFIDVPEFRSTTFTHHLSLDNISYPASRQHHKLGPITLLLEREACSKDIPKLQRLKDLAETNGDHLLALKCHADELRTRRWGETKKFESMMDALYDEFCDYGQSISRPTRYLIYVTVIFSLIYFNLSSKQIVEFSLSSYLLSWSEYLLFSFSNCFPFLAVSRDIRIHSMGSLFNESEFSTIYALLTIQGFISAILFFLIGLSLRNHFRI